MKIGLHNSFDAQEKKAEDFVNIRPQMHRTELSV